MSSHHQQFPQQPEEKNSKQHISNWQLKGGFGLNLYELKFMAWIEAVWKFQQVFQSIILTSCYNQQSGINKINTLQMLNLNKKFLIFIIFYEYVFKTTEI